MEIGPIHYLLSASKMVTFTPLLSVSLTSAPCSTRYSTVQKSPSLAASCSEVRGVGWQRERQQKLKVCVINSIKIDPSKAEQCCWSDYVELFTSSPDILQLHKSWFLLDRAVLESAFITLLILKSTLINNNLEISLVLTTFWEYSPKFWLCSIDGFSPGGTCGYETKCSKMYLK